MKQSKLFTRTAAEVNAQIQSKNARLLIKAGYIRQETAGVYTMLPLGLRVLGKIEDIVRQEIDKVGTEILMPALSAKAHWQQTNRFDTVDVLFQASGANALATLKNKSSYVLCPTHEEVVTPLVQEFATSYRDLPVAVYQIQTKYRNEERAKNGLLRCREFRMKDLYSFHRSEADLLEYYETIKQVYKRIFDRVGIGEDTFLTYASGGDFTSEFSHEFQTLLSTGEDEIYLDRENGVAYNQEIVNEKNEQKLKVDFSGLEKMRASEVGNIFPLNTKFSNAFNYSYSDEQNKRCPVYMGCYGIGTSRLMAIVVEKFADEKGLIWPENIAPFTYHLITLDGDSVVAEGEKIYQQLAPDCLWDDRQKVTNGAKFKDAELIGCTYQLVLSQRSLQTEQLEVQSRSGAFAPLKVLIADIPRLAEVIAEREKENERE